MAKRTNGKSTFRLIYTLYVVLLLALLVSVFFYVRSTMVEYENSSADRYALWLVEDAKKDNALLSKYMEQNCFGETSPSGKVGDAAAREAYFKSTVKKAAISVVPAAGKTDATAPVYNVLADGKPFLTIGLKEDGRKTKLGILTISEWSIETCVLRKEGAEAVNLALDEAGTLSYTISVPDAFSVRIDGKEIGSAIPKELAAIDDFQYVAPFVDVPKMAIRELKGLTFEPTFTIYNNAGQPVEARVKNGSVTCDASFASTKEAETLGMAEVNALAIGELWSKFMTNDVGGEARGLYTVRNDCRLLPGSDLYKKATNWANSVDITFVSGHTIDSWTSESVTNYVLYNENLFSCDVAFEKNMSLKTGEKRTDAFRNRLFFINNKDAANGPLGWRLADMFSL